MQRGPWWIAESASSPTLECSPASPMAQLQAYLRFRSDGIGFPIRPYSHRPAVARLFVPIQFSLSILLFRIYIHAH